MIKLGTMRIESKDIKNDWVVSAYNKLNNQSPNQALADYNFLGDDISNLMESEGYSVEIAYESVLLNLQHTALGK